MRRLVQRLVWWRGKRGEGDGLVKVAGSLLEGEACTWAEALRSQGIQAKVQPYVEARQRTEPLAPPEWDVWVRQEDEPQARLILGLSGHSVIRLPRQKKAEKKP